MTSFDSDTRKSQIYLFYMQRSQERGHGICIVSQEIIKSKNTPEPLHGSILDDTRKILKVLKCLEVIHVDGTASKKSRITATTRY